MKYSPKYKAYLVSVFEDIMNIKKAEAEILVDSFESEFELSAAAAILMFISGDTESERAFAVRKRLLDDCERLRILWSDGN